jgi:uncharacterized protein YjbJ (UPF0337 family)
VNKGRVSGKVEQAIGKVKQSVGETVCNEKLANQGVADQAKGATKVIQLWQNKVCMTSWSPVFASLDGQEQGLVNSKVAACATKDFVHGVCVNEFEAVAKSASLASRRKNHHGSGRKREVQLQNLTQGSFKGQHRCDS